MVRYNPQQACENLFELLADHMRQQIEDANNSGKPLGAKAMAEIRQFLKDNDVRANDMNRGVHGIVEELEDLPHFDDEATA